MVMLLLQETAPHVSVALVSEDGVLGQHLLRMVRGDVAVDPLIRKRAVLLAGKAVATTMEVNPDRAVSMLKALCALLVDACESPVGEEALIALGEVGASGRTGAEMALASNKASSTPIC
jgi:hypothetical protein